MNILITGGEGYIASSLHNYLKNSYNVISVSRKDFDLTDSYQVNKFFENKYFDIVIHCAVVGGSRLKEDSYKEMDSNLKMYYNLHQLKDKYFKKLITFGSGAELFSSHTPYGLSKQVIAKSISETENFYNLLIFALFDQNELNSRFIKANIKRYINKEPIIIHQNKYMDFFYMEDFVKIVDYYINNDNCPKTINFSYKTKFQLSDVALMINNLSEYKVEIIIENKEHGLDYCGDYSLQFFDMEFSGLQTGIVKTYRELMRLSSL